MSSPGFLHSRRRLGGWLTTKDLTVHQPRGPLQQRSLLLNKALVCRVRTTKAKE